MNLKEFYALMYEVESWRNHARLMNSHADQLESKALSLAGVTHVDREPGFPCWRIEGVDGYFSSPADAVAARDAKVRGAVTP